MGQCPRVSAQITSGPGHDLESRSRTLLFFLLRRVSVMNTLLCLVLAPALLSAQLSYQVPESLSTDDENPNYRLTLPSKRTYVLHRGPNGEPRYSSLVRRNFYDLEKETVGRHSGNLTTQNFNTTTSSILSIEFQVQRNWSPNLKEQEITSDLEKEKSLELKALE